MNTTVDLFLFLPGYRGFAALRRQFSSWWRWYESARRIRPRHHFAASARSVSVFAQLWKPLGRYLQELMFSPGARQFLLHRIYKLICKTLPDMDALMAASTACLKRRFVQCRKFFAVFLSIVKRLCSAPRLVLTVLVSTPLYRHAVPHSPQNSRPLSAYLPL